MESEASAQYHFPVEHNLDGGEVNLFEEARKFLLERRYAYRKTFDGPLAEVVLKDLAHFCFANESTLHPNQKVQDAREGRREVWLRIEHHLHLSPEKLWELYQGTHD